MRASTMVLKKLQGAITSDDVLGKDVIDSKGVFLGVSDKLYIDPKSMAVLGISVDSGFLKKGFIISTQYVHEVVNHAIFLNIQPASSFKGKVVLDCNGTKVGIIKNIELIDDTNDIASFFVKPGFFRRKIRIPVKFMKNLDKSLFLSITKDELYDKVSKANDASLKTSG